MICIMSVKGNKMSDLAEFKKSVELLNEERTEEQSVPQQNLIQIKKNVLLSYVSDATGCGHIRTIFPMTYLNAVYGKDATVIPMITPIFVWQEDILIRTRTIHFQRQMTPDHLKVIQRYKELQPKFQYKMVYDIDDFIWGKNELQGGTKFDGVPTYNFGHTNITQEIKDSSIEIMKLMDRICVSSEYLKKYISEDLGINVPIHYVPNTVNLSFWGNDKRKPKKNRIERPKVIYTGSPTHYNNFTKHLGDFDNSWKQYIIEAVSRNEIEFFCMGGLPFFFEDIKDRIHVIDWVNSYQYHLAVKDTKADIAFGPLVPNNFNYSKSFIKATESYAAGMPFIGTTFSNGMPSPYDTNLINVKDTATVDEIRAVIDSLKDPNVFNSIVQQQYNILVEGGFYTETAKAVERYMNGYFI